MKLDTTALILIGYQNDYFSEDGILHSVVEESVRVGGVLRNTLELLEKRGKDFGLVVSTPIVFTPNYLELADAVGILKTIRELGAFKQGTKGAEPISELSKFAEIINEVPGKRGLDAFSNTQLEVQLREKNIETVVLAGAVTSICIDSTGRHAAEAGFSVQILSDCTSGRTEVEQKFYCENIFPLYAGVCNHHQLVAA